MKKPNIHTVINIQITALNNQLMTILNIHRIFSNKQLNQLCKHITKYVDTRSIAVIDNTP